MIDSRDTNELHPALKRACTELKRRMSALGYDVLVTSTYRDGEYQDFLYEQGRSRPGAIVTNAKAGRSIHNYRLAFDICKNLRGHEYDDRDFFDAGGLLGVDMGLVWGGNFKNLVDKPHFEFTGGLSLTELAAGKVLPDDYVMEWEKKPAVTAEKPDDRVRPDLATMLIDGKHTEVERILYDGYNYIKLRELSKFGIKVGYDEALKMPVLDSGTGYR